MAAIATLTSSQQQDLTLYQTMIVNFTNLLDKEAAISSELRQLSSDNITAINSTIGTLDSNIDSILENPGPVAP